MYTELLKNLTNEDVITIFDSNCDKEDELEQIGRSIGATGDLNKIELLRSLILHRAENRMVPTIHLDKALYVLVIKIECSKQQVIEYLELLAKLQQGLYTIDTADILMKHKFSIPEIAVLEKRFAKFGFDDILDFFFSYSTINLPSDKMYEYLRQVCEYFPASYFPLNHLYKNLTLIEIKALLLQHQPTFYQLNENTFYPNSWLGEPNDKYWRITDLSEEDRIEIVRAILNRNNSSEKLISVIYHYRIVGWIGTYCKNLLEEERYAELEEFIIANAYKLNNNALCKAGNAALLHKITNSKGGTLTSAQNMNNMFAVFEYFNALLTIYKYTFSIRQSDALTRLLFEVLNYGSLYGRGQLLTPILQLLNSPQRFNIFVDNFAKFPSRTLLAGLLFASKMQSNEHVERIEKLLENLPTFYNDGHYQRTLVATILKILPAENITDNFQHVISALEQILATVRTNVLFSPVSVDYINVPNSINILLSEDDHKLKIFVECMDKENRRFRLEYPTPKTLVNTPLSATARLKAKILVLAPQIISKLQKMEVILEPAILQQRSLYILSVLSDFDNFGAIISNKNLNILELERQYSLAFSDTFKISKHNFNRYIKPLHNIEAILVYRKSLLALDKKYKQQVSNGNQDEELESTRYLKLLDKFVHLLAKPSYSMYKKQRYYPPGPDIHTVIIANGKDYSCTGSNAHLATINTLNKKAYESWQNDSSLPLIAMQHSMSKCDSKPNIDIYEILYNAVVKHNHLDLQYFTAVDAYFKNNMNSVKLILSGMKNNKDQLERNQVILQLLIKARSFNNPKNVLPYINSAIGVVQRMYNPTPQLLADLKMLKNAICYLSMHKQQDINNLKIVNTDSPWNMFLIGTDVEGSCQNVESEGSNRCLIGGYVMSGHVRQIAILDNTNKIIARAVLRILCDLEDFKPVLHVEEVYPRVSSGFMKEAILNFAALAGLKLELDVVSSQDSIHPYPAYDNPLRCLQVNLTEYVDTIGSMKDEPYEFKAGTTKQLFNFMKFKQERFEHVSKHLGPERPLRDNYAKIGAP